MGRPAKKGLDWFLLDVDFFDDYKIMDLLSEYGPNGMAVYMVALTEVYKNGYYLEIPIEKFATKAVRLIGNRWIKKDFVMQVMLYCADIGLLHKDLLSQGVITSVGLQKRYSTVTVRNKVHKDQFWILDKNNNPLLNAPFLPDSVAEKEVSVTEKSISATEKPIDKIRLDKKKERGKKEIDATEKRINYQLIADMYNDTCVSFPKVTKLSEARKKAIHARMRKYSLEDFERLFRMAENSDFLKGQNKRNWSATFDWLIKDANMAKVLDGNYNDKEERYECRANEEYDADAEFDELRRMYEAL